LNEPAGRPRDPLVFVFFNEVGIIEQLARSQLERVLPAGLKAPHFGVLNHLVRLGDDKSPLSLARAFQVSKGTMTNTLQRLEARGFVALQPDPEDGRGKRVFLTETGRGMREAAIKAVVPSMMDLMVRFSEADFERALPFLQSIRAYLDEARNPKPKRKRDHNAKAV